LYVYLNISSVLLDIFLSVYKALMMIAAANKYTAPPQYTTNAGLQPAQQDDEDDDDEKSLASVLSTAQGLKPTPAPVIRVPMVPSFLPVPPLKQDTFTLKSPTATTEQVNHIPPELLAKLLQDSANQQEQSGVEARPSFTLTTSLPDERFIKNPVSKGVTATFFSTTIGAIVFGLLGATAIKLRPQPTGFAYALGSGLGVLVGGVAGLLLGTMVLGRVAEQQQEMENKIHLTKTRVLVEQLTPISLDPVRIKVKRKKKSALPTIVTSLPAH
jgi:hypothetical protein